MSYVAPSVVRLEPKTAQEVLNFRGTSRRLNFFDVMNGGPTNSIRVAGPSIVRIDGLVDGLGLTIDPFQMFSLICCPENDSGLLTNGFTPKGNYFFLPVAGLYFFRIQPVIDTSPITVTTALAVTVFENVPPEMVTYVFSSVWTSLVWTGPLILVNVGANASLTAGLISELPVANGSTIAKARMFNAYKVKVSNVGNFPISINFGGTNVIGVFSFGHPLALGATLEFDLAGTSGIYMQSNGGLGAACCTWYFR